MPIIQDDSELEEEQEEQETGKGLRAKLEATLEANRTLQSELTSLKVDKTLRDGGFDLVKPEELAGVPVDRVEARAKELQEERQTLQQDLLRAALEKSGFEGETLEELVQRAAGQLGQETQEAQAVGRARSLGRLDSSPVPAQDTSKLHGLDAIRAGLTQPRK